MKYCKELSTIFPSTLTRTATHRVSPLRSSHWTTMLEMGGSDYTFQKLKRWRAERPTERNRKMGQFIIGHGYMI